MKILPFVVPCNKRLLKLLEITSLFDTRLPYFASRTVQISRQIPVKDTMNFQVTRFPPASPLFSTRFTAGMKALVPSFIESKYQGQKAQDRRGIQGEALHSRFSTKSLTRAQNKLGKLNQDKNKLVDKYKVQLSRCKKETSKKLIERLDFTTNILGIDQNRKNGSLKVGGINALVLDLKMKFPKEIILVQIGEFYEAWGYDAVMLVEYANLNPSGGVDSAAVPKAGFPLRNLRQTLKDLNGYGMSACIVKEIGGPTKAANERKQRFVSGHSHKGVPYVCDLARDEVDTNFFPLEAVPHVALARTSRGYTLISAYISDFKYKVEEGLTEEGVLAKLRSCEPAEGFLHVSLKDARNEMSRWTGPLRTECKNRQFEAYEGDPVAVLLQKVTEFYDKDENEEEEGVECTVTRFRRMESPPGVRPRPLYTSAASQIGILPTVGVPSLLHVLLPEGANALCQIYLKELLLNPPPPAVAAAIQASCKLFGSTRSPLPDFSSESATKLVILLREKEASHHQFRKIFEIVQDVVFMFESPELKQIGEHLLLPTWLSTGIRIDAEQLILDCKAVEKHIDDAIVIASHDYGSSIEFSNEPPEEEVRKPLKDLYEEMEMNWRGRVHRRCVEEAYNNVDLAVEELNEQVKKWFVPIVHWQSKSKDKRKKSEIVFHKEQGTIYLKGKNLRPTQQELALGDFPGLQQAKSLEHVIAKGALKAVPDLWTCKEVDDAVERYHDACRAAGDAVVNKLKEVAEDLEKKLDAIITATTFSLIALTFMLHTGNLRLRGWVHATLLSEGNSTSTSSENFSVDPKNASSRQMTINGFFPYWLGNTGDIVRNSVTLDSMCLLTGPNGGGKSSVLRSIYAVALLANCGLMVPAKEAKIPQFDALFLRMMATDSPIDAKSSFQMEMAELSTILAEASQNSLVLMDELCKGTEVLKGTGLVAASLEELAFRKCIGAISTHLHGVLDVKLKADNIVRKAMRTKVENGLTRVAWELVDGECRESLAFEVALKEGVPKRLVDRGEEVSIKLGLNKGFGKKNNDKGWKETVPTGKLLDSLNKTVIDDKHLEVSVRTLDSSEENIFEFSERTNEDWDEEKELRDREERTLSASDSRREYIIAHGFHSLEPVIMETLKEFVDCSEDFGDALKVLGPMDKPTVEECRVPHVYIFRLENGLFQVGKAPDIGRRIRVYRYTFPGAVFGYIRVPEKRTNIFHNVLLKKLKAAGFPVVVADLNRKSQTTSTDLGPF